jgi:hypothetical protein
MEREGREIDRDRDREENKGEEGERKGDIQG